MTTRQNLQSALTAAQTRLADAQAILGAVSKAGIAGPALTKVTKDHEKATKAVADAGARLDEWDKMPKSRVELLAFITPRPDETLEDVARLLASWLGLPDELKEEVK